MGDHEPVITTTGREANVYCACGWTARLTDTHPGHAAAKAYADHLRTVLQADGDVPEEEHA